MSTALSEPRFKAIYRDELRDALQAELERLMLTVPMPPAEEVPEGKDDNENRELRTHGTPRQPEDGEIRDHVALVDQLNLVDFERGARVGASPASPA